ncbi:MAG: agmatine deiminase family protein [Bacteroidetes bacterium]|nr:MAG: agmatine deiminase family protein [Bacteroidota bacterium]
MPTPAALGYTFPAEWAPHRATWLSWPHKEASWPGKLEAVYPVYSEFVRLLSEQEEVHINVLHDEMAAQVERRLQAAGARMDQVFLHLFPTNDAWCRDHGPAFVVRPGTEAPLALIDWGYNAWGGKYPPFDLDNQIPQRVAGYRDIPFFSPGIIMEGGSIEVNGAGTLLTTEACLLNPNRNPQLNRAQIEQYLRDYYGQQQILWLHDGIVGDDTDGHIDDLTRFVGEDTVVTMVERRPADDNYGLLQENLDRLRTFRLPDGRPLRILELPMPDPVVYDGQRLPAAYANFYIANGLVVVPTYRCAQDAEALAILADCFPDRKVVGLDSTDIIWGLGSFHCLSQQEPALID